ncbi:MAG: hypothetical protein RL347_1530 [Actinomycetota bacterium]
MSVDDIDHEHVAWLLALRGEQTLAQALARGRADALKVVTMRRLVRAAIGCGLLDDASTLPRTLRDAPIAVRDAIACDVAAARHIYAQGAHGVIDRRQESSVVVQGNGTVADVAASVLASAGIGRVLPAAVTHSGSRKHRQSAARHACHIICDAAHPDAASGSDAMALDIPHLAVAAAGGRAVIGPLVVPGRTSCLRCRDLHLADADPTWSRAAVQWAARRPSATARGLEHLAGSWAAIQVLSLIDAGPDEACPPTVNGALVITLPAAAPALESRPPHPLCGCRWPRTGRGISA